MTQFSGSGTEFTELSIVLADDRSIRKLNREYFGRVGVTDVISFRYDPLPGEDLSQSGEVVVNVEEALRQTGPEHELALYVAHGCDHLSGESDETPEGYSRMRRRELRRLKKAAELGLVAGLISGRRGKKQ